MFVSQLNFRNFQKKKVDIVKIAYYNNVTIEMDNFKIYVSIICNLVFLFITSIFLNNDYLKNENKVFFEFLFFSTQFPSLISKT
jgi:hypothetical protein